MTNTLKVGILGATGTVGQRFIVLLSKNPNFVIYCLGASERSSGKIYKDAVKWKISDPMPKAVATLNVFPCKSSEFTGCDLVFSGLDASVAGEIEKDFFENGFPVFSNAKNYRMLDSVPLIVPTANSEHMNIVPSQTKNLSNKNGFIVTNSNCSVSGISVVLKALQDKFGQVSNVIVNTMQAISGAGYPGVPSLDIMDNVVPYIGGEEEKIETELLKILGSISTDISSICSINQTKVSATCNRVPVLDGHLASVSIKFASPTPPSIDEIKSCLSDYVSESQILGCHSAPINAIHVMDSPDRPQPRLDRMNDNGMAVTVGRIRECPVFDIRMSVLVHNTILGAAGASILNAEIAVKKGLIKI